MHQPSKEEATGETGKMRKAAKLEMQTEKKGVGQEPIGEAGFKEKGKCETGTKKKKKSIQKMCLV